MKNKHCISNSIISDLLKQFFHVTLKLKNKHIMLIHEMKHIEAVDIFKYSLCLAYLITSADDPLNNLICQLPLTYLLVFLASVTAVNRITNEAKSSP